MAEEEIINMQPGAVTQIQTMTQRRIEAGLKVLKMEGEEYFDHLVGKE